MASRSLGTLTLDLVAKIGGYTAGLDKAEKEAAKRAKAIEGAFDAAAIGVGVAFGAMATAAAGAFAVITQGIEKAANFQDLAELTGGSAEGLASISVAAATAGVSMDSVAAASNKLTKNLTGVDDESQAAGAAIKALGLNLDEFKKLNAEERIDALTKAFANFSQEGASGLSRVAVAMDLWGKSGAEQLKVMNALEEQGGRTTILTAEQIKLADDYADAQSKAREELSLYVAAASTEFIPIFTAVITLAKDAIKEFTGLGDESNKLGGNTGVKTFADNAVAVLGFVVDAAEGVSKAFEATGKTIAAAAAQASALASGEFKQVLTIGKEWQSDMSAILDRKLFSDKLKAQVQAGRDAVKNAAQDANKLALAYEGATSKPKKTGGSNTAAQEAKAQLQSDLADIKAAQDAIVNTYQNAGKILEAERSAGLKDEQEYYAEKRRLMLASNDAEQAGLEQTITRLQAEKLSGKDAIENTRKITEATAKLTKAREDAATSVQVLAIQEESSYKKIAGALLAARQAAQDYYDTTNRGYERMLGGLGGGNKQREQLAAIQQIEDRYQQQRQDLANRRSQAELQSGGALTAAQAKQYDDQLAIINEFQDKALGSYQSYYAKLDAAQKDWSIGATEALRNYADEAANTAKQTEEVFTNAFKGAEDALTEFATGGKADVKGLVDSIIKDLTRMAIKQAITGPAANWMSGLIGGASSAASSSTTGDVLGAFINAKGFASGGFTGHGNPDEPAGIVHKGEWVIPAQQVREIGAGNLASGNLGGGLNVTYVVPGRIDLNTQTQLAQKTRRETLDVARRF